MRVFLFFRLILAPFDYIYTITNTTTINYLRITITLDE